MADNVKVKTTKNPATNGFTKFFRELKAEFKRVTWPSKTDVKKATVAAVVFCVIYMVIVGLLDYGFKGIFDFIFKLK